MWEGPTMLSSSVWPETGSTLRHLECGYGNPWARHSKTTPMPGARSTSVGGLSITGTSVKEKGRRERRGREGGREGERKEEGGKGGSHTDFDRRNTLTSHHHVDLSIHCCEAGADIAAVGASVTDVGCPDEQTPIRTDQQVAVQGWIQECRAVDEPAEGGFWRTRASAGEEERGRGSDDHRGGRHTANAGVSCRGKKAHSIFLSLKALCTHPAL